MWSVAASADGRWLASGAGDGDTIVYDLGVVRGEAPSQPIGSVNGTHSRAVLGVALDGSGSRIATASENGSFSLWDVAWVASACHLAGRNLTEAERKQFLDTTSATATAPTCPGFPG